MSTADEHHDPIPAPDTPEFAALLRKLVTASAPDVSALCETRTDPVDARVRAWCFDFGDGDTLAVNALGPGSIECSSPEAARTLLTGPGELRIVPLPPPSAPA